MVGWLVIHICPISISQSESTLAVSPAPGPQLNSLAHTIKARVEIGAERRYISAALKGSVSLTDGHSDGHYFR